MFDMHDIKLEDAKLIQSKYYLHTQAEDHIKIDIVWETSRAQDVSDYNILGVYLECKGNQMDNFHQYMIHMKVVTGTNGWLILV